MQVILHTGDMRWNPRMGKHPALAKQRIDQLFLDTTYASPKHTFPSQVCRTCLSHNSACADVGMYRQASRRQVPHSDLIRLNFRIKGQYLDPERRCSSCNAELRLIGMLQCFARLGH